jgi:TPP-dependent pyruvate/acetoin dehydrogenase alpha subunit
LNLRIEIVEKFEESVLTELEGNLRKKVEQALNFAIQSDPPNEYEMVHGVYA